MALHEKPVDRNMCLVCLLPRLSHGESGVRVQMPAATNTCSQEMQTLPRYRQTERTRIDDAFGATSKRIELSFARSWRPGPTVPCAGLPAPPRTGIIDMSSAPPRPKRGEEHGAQADGMLFSWCCLRCCATQCITTQRPLSLIGPDFIIPQPNPGSDASPPCRRRRILTEPVRPARSLLNLVLAFATAASIPVRNFSPSALCVPCACLARPRLASPSADAASRFSLSRCPLITSSQGSLARPRAP